MKFKSMKLRFTFTKALTNATERLYSGIRPDQLLFMKIITRNI